MSEQQPEQLHITEFFQYQLEQWSWGKVAWGCALAATISVCSVVSTNDDRNWLKALSAIAGIGATTVGIMGADRAFGRQNRVQDIKDLSDQGFTQELYNSMVDPERERPQAALASEKKKWEPKKLFSIFDLVKPENRTSIPHVLVLGNTGSGKTFLIKELFLRSPAKQKIYVSPTKEEDEMNVPGIRYVGCGLNPSQNGDYVAIKRFFEESTVDVKARMKMSKQQKLLIGFTECAIDEIPAISLEMSWSDWFLRIVSLARKQGFRLWVPTTGDQVKTLGIEGRGDMRENLKYLRLGDAVEPYLQQLVADKKYPQAVLEWYEEMTDAGYRVFTFEDKIGIMPEFQVTESYAEVEEEESNPFAVPNGLPLTESAEVPYTPTDKLPETPSFTVTVPVDEIGDLTDVEIQTRTVWTGMLQAGGWKSKILLKTGFGGKRYKEGEALWAKLKLPDRL